MVESAMVMHELERGDSAARQKIAVVEASLLGLLDRILPEVEAGRVSSLVVDDTSGRAIGLFLHRALDRLGHPLPISFVCPPGPGPDGKRAVAHVAPAQVAVLGEYPLIVTEVIHSGEAVGSIVRAVNATGRIPAIASLSGFLVPRDPNEPWSTLVPSPAGRTPPGTYSTVFMPAQLSFDAQDLLCSDKVTAGVLREDVGSPRVLSAARMCPTPEVRRAVRAFREELYALAAHAANINSPG